MCRLRLGSDHVWLGQAACLVVNGDLVLQDLLDHYFQVGHDVRALDQGAGAVHQLDHALLDQGGELEAAADLVHDFVALEGFDHFPFCPLSVSVAGTANYMPPARLCLTVLMISSTARSTVSLITMWSKARLPLAMRT